MKYILLPLLVLLFGCKSTFVCIDKEKNNIVKVGSNEQYYQIRILVKEKDFKNIEKGKTFKILKSHYKIINYLNY